MAGRTRSAGIPSADSNSSAEMVNWTPRLVLLARLGQVEAALRGLLGSGDVSDSEEAGHGQGRGADQHQAGQAPRRDPHPLLHLAARTR